MLAVIQNYGDGKLSVSEMPAPALLPGGILVQTQASLISSGTERLLVEVARKSLLGKALERPDKALEALRKVKNDGVLSAVEAVRRRLDEPMALGYSSAGTILAVGQGVDGFRVGDRVACAGTGYAGHAEIVFVPKNLAVCIPDGLDFESAAFTAVGAVALEGLRLAEAQLGESVAVIGLGLVGLIAAQLAKAAGCRVLGMDLLSERCRLAEKLGIDFATTEEQALAAQCRGLQGQGIDKVIIAAGTKSDGPVALAGEISRERGVVVAIGAVGMDIPRKLYYEKELTFKVSRSCGPGRYDFEYEEKGRDYPIAYARWTENRNMQAFVEQLACGKVKARELITHRFPLAQAPRAYELLTSKDEASCLGAVLTYPKEVGLSRRVEIRSVGGSMGSASTAQIGLLGAGAFACGMLLPAMKKVPGINLVGVCAATGVKARHAAEKFGFGYASTDEAAVINDPEINAVVIATRHHLHARQIIAALKAGKHVFCEKPLALNARELMEIMAAQSRSSGLLMVGYNRRFAPMAIELKNFMAQIQEPVLMNYRVNAGLIPLENWVQDMETGGGRLIGEVCHFADFLTFLAGALPRRVYARGLVNGGKYLDDNLALILEFSNGSLGNIIYAANGDKSLAKERLEVFGGQAAAVLDNFRGLKLMRAGRCRRFNSWFIQDKGHAGEWEAFVSALKGGGPQPIAAAELAAASLATFAALESLRSGNAVEIDAAGFLAELSPKIG